MLLSDIAPCIGLFCDLSFALPLLSGGFCALSLWKVLCYEEHCLPCNHIHAPHKKSWCMLLPLYVLSSLIKPKCLTLPTQSSFSGLPRWTQHNHRRSPDQSFLLADGKERKSKKLCRRGNKRDLKYEKNLAHHYWLEERWHPRPQNADSF